MKIELVTLQETKYKRVYNFVEYDEKTGVMIHRQLENDNGKIVVRTRFSFSRTLS